MYTVYTEMNTSDSTVLCHVKAPKHLKPRFTCIYEDTHVLQMSDVYKTLNFKVSVRGRRLAAPRFAPVYVFV